MATTPEYDGPSGEFLYGSQRFDAIQKRFTEVEARLSERLSTFETSVSKRLTRIETLLEERLPERR